MNCVVIICGPAATGKTTVVSELIKKYNAYYFRPCDSFFKLGEERGVNPSEVFNLISDIDAGKEYNKVCFEHDMIICDQHLAIQFSKDTKLATGEYLEVENDEEYVEALSKEFMENFLTGEINPLVICLYANPHTLYNRAISRNRETGMIVRNESINMTKKELESEIYFYDKLINDYMIDGCMIDTSDLSKEEVFDCVVQRIEQFRSKKELTLKWPKQLPGRK